MLNDIFSKISIANLLLQSTLGMLDKTPKKLHDQTVASMNV